jgi:hypothetical protein
MSAWLIEQYQSRCKRNPAEFERWLIEVTPQLVSSWGDTSKLNRVEWVLRRVADATACEVRVPIAMIRASERDQISI